MATLAPPRPSTRVAPLILAVVLAVAIVLLLAAVLALSGFAVGPALGALVRGAAGSGYAIFSATLVRATPLILTGLAVALAFKGGILNIGAEGQLLAGAAVAAAVALGTGDSLGAGALVLALFAAAGGGAAWAAIPAWLRRRFGVLEVISTIMMNFVALYLVGYLVRGPLQEPTRVYPQSSTLPAATHLPTLVPGTRLHAGFAIAVVASCCAWYVVRNLAAGFRLRVVGVNPEAAASAGGIDVPAVTMRTFLLSGALAGLAGGVELTGVTYALYENISPGYGYTAIAVALLAGLHPGLVIVSGVFLGALEAGAAAMQREAGVPLVLVSVVEASIILAIVGARAILARLTPRAGGANG
ncbi:MAG: ABC transporter permease [Gemmatimonadota bacterium]